MTDLISWLRQQLDTDEQGLAQALRTEDYGPWEYAQRTVQAHRAILDLYEELYEPHLYEACQHLAAIYSDRDGYRAEWSA